jgi:hypothetical protein
MRARHLILLCALLPACVDVRGFAGAWSGAIIADEPVLQGFAPATRVDQLVLSNLDLRGVTAVLTTTDGRFQQTRLTPVTKFASDPLATLTFDGSPLRSYMLFASSQLSTDPPGSPVLLLISLFSDDHVELRAIRGNDLFGVFQLYRPK